MSIGLGEILIRGRRSVSGIALFYVLCLVMVVTAFLGAALYRYVTSARFLSFDSDTVKARLLADSGASLALVLLRDRSANWYSDERFEEVVTSGELGYTKDDLEGSFDLEFKQLEELYAGNGTFLTVISTGRCDGRTAKTAVTVKVTSPLTNFVSVSNGNYDIGAWGNPSIQGPLFVNANGDAGQLRIWHDTISEKAYQPGVDQHSGGNVQLGIEAKAAGDIKVSNLDWKNRIGSGLALEGEYKKGTNKINQDLPEAAKGKVTFVEDSAAQSNVEINLKIPTTEEALFTFRSRENVTTIDVSKYGEGVLAEFIDGKLVLSAAKNRVIGKVFDKSVASESMGTYRENAALQYQLSSHDAETAVRKEVLIDDPMFPNGEYPEALKNDYDGDGVIEEEGDYFEVGRIVRGDPIATISLGESDFSSVRLVTDNTSYASPDPTRTQGPNLYIRGVVDGKVSLAYDVSDNSLDPKFDKLHTYILAEHEMPGENLRTVTSKSGVPGGLNYADPNVGKVSGSSDSVSNDMAFILSRGTISGTGQPLRGKKQVYQSDGTVVDYAQQLKDLDQRYIDEFGGGNSARAADFKIADNSSPRTALYGIFVGNHADRTVWRTTSNQGGSGRVDRFHSAQRWSATSSPMPAYAQSDYRVIGLEALRSAYSEHTVYPRLFGSISSLGKRTSFSYGNAAYDYRFQSLDAETLSVSIGVPTSVVLCTWQRL